MADSSDQPPWYRFALGKLLIGVTLLALLFGFFGVPNTVLLAVVAFTLGSYVGIAYLFGAVPLFVLHFGLAFLVTLMETLDFKFR